MKKVQEIQRMRSVLISSIKMTYRLRLIFQFLTIFFVFGSIQNGLLAQKKFILIDHQSKKEYIKKDSTLAVKFLDSLAENNFYFTKIVRVTKVNQITKIHFDKGKNYNQAILQIDAELASLGKLKQEFFVQNLDSLKRVILQLYTDRGFAFSRVKTRFLGLKDDVPIVQLSVNSGDLRKIDGFVLKGYDKVPKRFKKNLNKEFVGKTYDEKNLLRINQSLQNHPFLILERPPQTLFTKDSTNVFLFLQKKKANSFDGIIGFGNDKSEKFTFNGTLDLQFRNVFHGFEKLGLFWQRNPDRGQTFTLGVDLPYVMGSNLGTNFEVNIYRQDSTFANVRVHPAFYYHITTRQKLGIRGNFETSSVLDSTYVQAKDFSKQGIGVWYDYTEPTEISLFQYRTRLITALDFINTNYSKDDLDAKQTKFSVFAERNFKIRGSHYLNIKGEGVFLNSQLPLTANELLRFGGWNSLRGFNENSLLADQYFFGGAEYRYLVNEQAFFDLFLHYGQLNNKSLNLRPKLYSFGLGFNFFLPIGLMTFQVSNGSQTGTPIRFSDTKIHWGIVTKF